MLTIDQVFAETQKNSRICPQPQDWQQFYDLLPRKQRLGNGWQPSLPLILGAWWHSSDSEKQSRLREHIKWAAEHEHLSEIYAFLSALPESSWHHQGE